MFKKMISIVAVLGLALALAPAVASAAVMPWDSIVGSYRLLFTTSGSHNGSSNDIGVYNSFVNEQADLTGSIVKPLGLDWFAIGSVKDGISAQANTNTWLSGDSAYTAANDVPIYRLDGQLLASDNADLWDGSLKPYWVSVDQDGDYISVGVFTGTADDGSHYSGKALGDTSVARGTTNPGNNTDLEWLNDSTSTATFSKSFYALSEPIPEPATMTLLAIGGFGVLLMRRRRRA